MNNAIRTCGAHDIPCPARCNGWCLPCQDEADFADDLAPSKGIITSVVFASLIWAGVLVWVLA